MTVQRLIEATDMTWTYMSDGRDCYLWQTYYNSTAESGANNKLKHSNLFEGIKGENWLNGLKIVFDFRKDGNERRLRHALHLPD